MNKKRAIRCINHLAALTAVCALMAIASSAGWAPKPRGNYIRLIDPTDKDFSKWRKRKPNSEWIMVGKMFLDPKDDKRLAWTPGAGVAVNGKKGRTDNLFSKHEHADIELHVDFMVPKGSNSGVYFMGRYEIQVFDSWGVKKPKYSDCGGIYERWKDNKGYEGHGPRVNASRKPGEWQSFDVVFRAPRFDAGGKKTENAKFIKVVHNGRVVHENVEVTGPTRAAGFQDEKPTGPIMLQGDHGPVAYANLRIRPLKEAFKPQAAGPTAGPTYERLARYEFGDDRRDLTAIDEALRSATPEQLRQIELGLLGVLLSPNSTFAAKQFVCRMLRRMGSVQTVPALARHLGDENLSHMARYAMERMPYSEVDAALRGALGKIDGPQKIGIISTIAARRDKRAVAQLTALAKANDAAVASAASLALERIGSGASK